MEVIKKKFLLNVTATTATTYTLNVLLTANLKDLGFFDTSDDPYTGTTEENALFTTPYTVTGTSESRLIELEKYVVTSNPLQKYYSSSGPGNDGLIAFVSGSSGVTYLYRIGAITYADVIPTGTTTGTTSFVFTATGLSSYNFDKKYLVKFESKQNMVENPQVNNDVFIVRQQQPVLEKNYRLRAVNGLNDTLTYAGGNYFTIYNNT